MFRTGSRVVTHWWILVVGCLLVWSCTDPQGEESTVDAKVDVQMDLANDDLVDDFKTDLEQEPDVYVTQADPYSPGGLPVKIMELAPEKSGNPVAVRIHLPRTGGSYAVVVFQHGFLANNVFYTDLLNQVASHGFVVVAPQMYESDGLPFDKPTTEDEAALAGELLTWIGTELQELTEGKAAVNRLGLAGHSRGGKVIWMLLSDDPTRAMAVAGVDPVDGTGGPGGTEERVVSGDFGFDFPTLVVGTGLGEVEVSAGSACAPAGDNHVQFFEASAGPAYHLIALDYGHNDLLDDNPTNCPFACELCPGADEKAPMRAFTAGALVLFFRGTLQGMPSSLDELKTAASMPVSVVVVSK